MNAFARLHKAIDYLKDNGKIHIQRDIVAAINGNESNVTQALKGNPRYLTKPFLQKFARAYSDYINEEWLVSGVGRMENVSQTMRPHYDARASAGFMDGISEGRMSAEFRAIAVPVLGYDFSIDADGNSMLPKIESGDTLLCRVETDRLNPPIGEVCVIDTKDGAVVKVIKEVNEDSLVLHSLNPEYADYTIEFSSINKIARVVGLIRSFIG